MGGLGRTHGSGSYVMGIVRGEKRSGWGKELGG